MPIHMSIFAQNFRGFKDISIDLGQVNFIVGDNSSGKTSILSLLQIVTSQKFANDLEIFGIAPKIKHYQDVFSPYIESDKVLVGYKYLDTEDERSYDARLVTYRQHRERGFLAEKFSVAHKGRVRHVITRRRKLLQYSGQNESLNPEGFEGFMAEHLSQSGAYRGTLFDKAPDGIPVAFALVMVASIDEEKKQITLPFFRTRPTLENRFYGPIRLDPRRAYELEIGPFDERGRHAPSALKEMYDRATASNNQQYITAINEFGQQSGMFDKLHVDSYKKKDPRAPFKVEVEKRGKRFSLDEVGYGVSQILPIVVDAILNRTDESIIISVQQPELHLHPKAQAAFGELLFKLAQSGLHFVVETHSDFIIDRYRYCKYLNRKSQLELSSKIFFAENTEQGNLCSEIIISRGGEVLDAPESYRAFFSREQDKILEMI